MAKLSRKSDDEAAGSAPPRTREFSREGAGLLIIAVAILIFTVVRYWRYIAWGTR